MKELPGLVMLTLEVIEPFLSSVCVGGGVRRDNLIL